MSCELCEIIKEEYRLIEETEHSFSIICEKPIKPGHLMVVPKRHVTQNKYSELSPEEAKDFLTLVERMQLLLSSRYEDDVMIFKNSSNHSSQLHFHMHLVPSKGAMRKLIATSENITTRPEVSKKDYEDMKLHILNNN